MSRLSLQLPDLEPGEQPPPTCPCCGAEQDRKAPDDLAVYQCGIDADGLGDPDARAYYYEEILETSEWRWFPARHCPTPSPAAIVAAMGGPAAAIRAALDAMTPEQRDAEAGREFDQYGQCGESIVFTVEDRVEEILAALETKGEA